MQNALLEEVLDAFEDLAHNLDCYCFLQFSASGNVGEQITIRTVLSDNKAMRRCFVDIETFDNVWMVQSLQYFYFIF